MFVKCCKSSSIEENVAQRLSAYLARLPPLHRDLFDRILIAQALQHGLMLATIDDTVRAYSIPLLPTK